MGEKKKGRTEHISGLVPLEPLDLGKCRNFDDLARAMSKTAFGGRALGEAVDVAEAMVRDKDCTKVLTLSGAMTMAKMGLVICDMIDNGLVDIVISTGALMAHGFIESAGMTHFKNPGNVSDEELCARKYNRVYDTLEPEDNLDAAENIIERVIAGIDHSRQIGSYEVTGALGKYLADNVEGRGVLKSAYLRKVPVFIPSFTDSEMGLDIAVYNMRRERNKKPPIKFDPFLDLNAYKDLVVKSKRLGIFTIGGGVPRNWAQQVGPFLDAMLFRFVAEGDIEKYKKESQKDSPYLKAFTYGVRICPEPAHWGGLSGCTYTEGVSWGKFVSKKEGGRHAEVLCDATIAWPIIIKALLERLKK